MKAAKTYETKGMLAKHYGFTEEELDLVPSTSLRAGINDDTCRQAGQINTG